MVWEVGGYVSSKLKTSAWGSGVVRQLSEYIHTQDSTVRGWSYRTIYKMVQFYETYSSTAFIELVGKVKPQIMPVEMAQIPSRQIVPIQSAQIQLAAIVPIRLAQIAFFWKKVAAVWKKICIFAAQKFSEHGKCCGHNIEYIWALSLRGGGYKLFV